LAVEAAEVATEAKVEVEATEAGTVSNDGKQVVTAVVRATLLF
jgi:hypothetical protein